MNCVFAINAHAQNTVNAKTLKDVYKDAFLIGVAVNPAIVSGKDKRAQEIVIDQFNSITPENVMKAALINPKPAKAVNQPSARTRQVTWPKKASIGRARGSRYHQSTRRSSPIWCSTCARRLSTRRRSGSPGPGGCRP